MKKLQYLADESPLSGDRGYVKYLRGERADELQEKYPSAFLLLCLIARRARRTPSDINKLAPGEALIGDHKKAGLTRQKYRTALDILCNLGFLTIRATSKGTIATLVDSSVFDINAERNNHQTNQQLTIKQPSSNHQATTNKKEKKEKNERMKEGERPSLDDLRAYITKNNYNVNAEKFMAHYESNGWRVGRNPMKDWRAAVRTWHHGDFNNGRNGRLHSSLRIGSHTEPEVLAGPQSELEVLTRMHTQTLREVNSLDRLLTDPTMRERYPDKISEWQAKRDNRQIELENIVRKLEEFEGEERTVDQGSTEGAATA